ncbi:MAG TPA: hypothetical protein VGR91_12550, partial [Stellaceae bacterium]|nr:hypothetical protein [Stellaceae bacterium]
MVLIRWIRAGLTWALFTALVGLMPLWIRLIGVFLGIFPEVGWAQILRDGMLLYFSIAIVAAVSADYYLVEDVKYSKYVRVYMIVIFPAILWFGF